MAGVQSRFMTLDNQGKMISGFILILLLMTVLITLATYTHDQQQQRLQVIANEHMKKQELVYQLRHHARERTVYLLRMYPMNDLLEIDELWEKFMEHGTQFLILREQFRQLNISEYEQMLLQHQRQISRIAQPLQQEIVNYIKQGDRDTALQGIDRLFRAQDDVLAILQELALYQQRAGELALQEQKAAHSEMRGVMWSIAAAVLAITIIISIAVTRQTLQHDRDRNAYLVQAQQTNELLQRNLQELEQARDAAQSANEAKSQFLAKMSHELRTPLNAVIGLTDLLVDVAQEKNYQDMLPDLEQVQQSGLHLLNLINDVLDLAKIESGKEELNVSATYLTNLAREVLSLMRPLAINTGNRLESEIDVANDMLYTDGRKLRQILINLLGNATKFTHNGQIKLKITEQQLENERVYFFSVRDTGVGMNAEQLHTIFEPFRQLQNHQGVQTPGSGLGLAIAGKFCRLLGGELEADSTPGRGSIFRFHIKDAVPMASDPNADTTHRPAPGGLLGALRRKP